MKEEDEKGLQREKLTLELDKLRAEIKALRNPILHNPGYLISLIFFAVSLTTALINWDAVSKRERLDTQLRQLTEEIEAKTEQAMRLQESIDAYKQQAGHLRAANQAVIEIASSRANLTKAEENTVQGAENASYVVYLKAYGIPRRLYDRLANLISQQGYSSLSQAEMIESITEHFARSPTVFYYDDSAKDKAQALAHLLSRKTELTFGVSMGSGQGIVAGSQRWTLVVHAR